MSGHVQCEDCGKCRTTVAAEDWCGYCEYFSCERGPDCADAKQAGVDDQVPALSEWEIAARRAIHECELQITSGRWSVHDIKHILEKAAACSTSH